MRRDAFVNAAPAVDLHGITRGRRSLNWLAGRFAHPWIDGLPGQLAARVFRRSGSSGDVAWPGPVWSRGPSGAPMLSWFVAPVANASTEAFAHAIDNALKREPNDANANAHTANVSDIEALMQRVARCAVLAGRNRYASCPEPLLAPKNVERVLLIDERERSTGLAAAVTRHSSQAFARMLHAARAAHPDADFWIAPSGDAGSGKWLSSSVNSSALTMSRLNDSAELCAALPYVDRVYTLSASEGLHALINGLPVHVHGTPWYAGWGLTHDDIPMPERTSRLRSRPCLT